MGSRKRSQRISHLFVLLLLDAKSLELCASLRLRKAAPAFETHAPQQALYLLNLARELTHRSHTVCHRDGCKIYVHCQTALADRRRVISSTIPVTVPYSDFLSLAASELTATVHMGMGVRKGGN